MDKVWRNAAGESLDFYARVSAFAVAYKITPGSMHTDSIEAVLGQMIPVLLSTDEPPVIHLLEGASRKVKQLTDVLSFLSQHGSKPCVDMLLKNSEFIVLQCQRSDLRSGSYTIAHTAAFLLQALQKSMTKYPRFFEVFLEVRDQQLLLK